MYMASSRLVADSSANMVSLPLLSTDPRSSPPTWQRWVVLHGAVAWVDESLIRTRNTGQGPVVSVVGEAPFSVGHCGSECEVAHVMEEK